jgi:hypothetical protein
VQTPISTPHVKADAGTEACRLYVHVAREARTAVILRRGPGKNTLMLKWDLERDVITEGQWIRHKIYERRCDLSPDGDYFSYFAAKFVGPLYSWTAVSKVPYFTALALWPKIDAWGGGALLDEKQTVYLNHRQDDMKTQPEKRLPRTWRVEQVGPWAGGGEDDPIESHRMFRDGWTVVQHGKVKFNTERKAKSFVTYDPPEILALKNPKTKSIALHRVRSRALIRQGKHYDETFIVMKDGREQRRFEYCDWAGWDHSGDLLIADDGKIWRVNSRGLGQPQNDGLSDARLISDLGPLRFMAVSAPAWAKTW